jgi:hypothetical protein
MALPPVVRRIVEAGGIARTGAGYRPGSTDLHLEALLPLGADVQLVNDLRADGWHVTITPTKDVLR